MPQYALRFLGWHPSRLNQWAGKHWSVKARLKKADREQVAFACWQADLPRAERKRRVTLILLLGKGQRAGDPDAYWKGLLDGLKQAGAIVNDSKDWVELMPVEFYRNGQSGTLILLQDL